MKFLAILKDSFREAVDCKALYALLSLSGLAILVVASLSFRPVPAEKMMEELVNGNIQGMFGRFHDEAAFEEGGKIPSRGGLYHVESAGTLAGAMDSPESEYVFSVSMRFPDKTETAKVRQDPKPAVEKIRNQFAAVEHLELLKIAEVRAVPAPKNAADNKAYFEIRTQPTKSTQRLWPCESSLFFGALPLPALVPMAGEPPLGIQLFLISSLVLSLGSWVAILVAVIITAFFIPNMLRKGTVDLMLVKPVHRWTILSFKYLGGLTFIFLNMTVAIVGIWVALGLRSGIWANTFLLMILVLTFFFAILYAVSTVTAVLTRSAVVAILVTCAAWFAFYLVGTLHLVFEARQRHEEAKNVPVEKRWGDNPVAKIMAALHVVTPRTSDLEQLGNRILLNDFLTGDIRKAADVQKTSLGWSESLTVSGAFIAVMLGLACWWFATKDY